MSIWGNTPKAFGVVVGTLPTTSTRVARAPVMECSKSFSAGCRKGQAGSLCSPDPQRARDFLVVQSGNHAKFMSNDQVPSPPTGLHQRNVAFVGRKRRSRGNIPAIQSRNYLREIFRRAGPTILFAVVPPTGGASSTSSKIKRLIFSQHRRRAVQSDVATRDRHNTARFFRATKYDSLDQIDSDGRSL